MKTLQIIENKFVYALPSNFEYYLCFILITVNNNFQLNDFSSSYFKTMN